MSASDVAIWILLGIGVLSFAFTALGMLLARDVYEQIQYTYPGATVGVVCIAAAVIVREALSQAGIKAILIAVILVWTNPVISHATARAIRVRRKGAWPPAPDEHIGTLPESDSQ